MTPIQVGAELREARESTGSSLAEVHDRTGILWRELEALEAGDLSKMFDRQRALVGLCRYAAHLGLDERPLAQAIERHWPVAKASSAAMTAFASPSNHPSVPMDTGHLRSHPGDGSHLSQCDETMTIPALGAAPLRYVYPRKVVAAPLPLRAAVWLVALLVVAGGAGLAATHGATHWMGDIHWGPAPSSAFAASPNASGSMVSAASKSAVLVVSSDTASAQIRVRAAQFSVLVVPTAPCWVQATTPSGIDPVFAGTLQPGSDQAIAAVGGQLTVQLGAAGVTMLVQVRGQTVAGWSFRPSVAPSVLNFVATSDS